MVRLMPFQGEFYDCPPTQGDALGYVLMAFQAVSMHGFHYFRNFSYCLRSGGGKELFRLRSIFSFDSLTP